MIINNRYKVIREMDKTFWATIYQVEDIRNGEMFALKLFSGLTCEEFYSRFSAEELTLLTRIKHPNIIRTYDFGLFGNAVYSLSAYYNLPFLNKFFFVRIDDIYKIINGICLGLDALHKEGLVHQNLRLENILYDPETMQTKILDCNFVNTEVSKQKLVVEYLPYLAPEVYDGEPAIVQSDLYSLGVILYYLTCGRFPFTIRQIQNLKSSESYYPITPSKINPQITPELDTLILRLLSRLPEERFANSLEILEYINQYSKNNKVQIPKNNENNLIFGKGTIHNKNLNQLLADLQTVQQQKNGRILYIIGDHGSGKSNLFRHFRYSILNENYTIFHYRCNQNNCDPLFTIVKECLDKNNSNQITQKCENISEKYKKFLYKSEEEAVKLPDSAEDVKADTEFIKKIFYSLAEQKTLVIIIENIDYLKPNTIQALDIISKSISTHSIFFVMSGCQHNTIDSVMHKNKVFLPNLDYENTEKFISHIIPGKEIKKPIIDLIFDKSAGNPEFVKKILLQLAQDHLLYNEEIPKEYHLPSAFSSNVKETIIHSLSQLPNYELIKKLSFFYIPITSGSIQEILKIPQKKVCFLLSDLLETHIFVHGNEAYHFNSQQSKLYLSQQLTKAEKEEIAKNVFDYYQSNPIDNLKTAEGLLKYSFILRNFVKAREYSLICAKLHLDNKQFEEAHFHYFQIGKLHSLRLLPQKFLWEDLETLTLNSKLNSLKSLRLLSQFPEDKTTKMRAVLLQDAGKIKSAETIFDEIKLDSSNIDKVLRIRKIRNKLLLNKLEQTSVLLDEFTPESPKEEVYKIIMQSELLLKRKNPDKATTILREFIENHSLNELKNNYILSKLYEVLANCLHIKRHLEEAEKYYLKAQQILKETEYSIGLCNNYIDLGGLYLTMGNTNKSLEYLSQAQKLTKNYTQGQLRISYSYGKTYIKMGEFERAIEYFEEAKKICKQTKNNFRYSMCKMHIASCIMKCKGYGEFYNYVLEFRPEIFNWEIKEFDPLVRAFFIYLISTEQIDGLEQKLEENSALYLKNKNHYEIYYSLLGRIASLKKDFDSAISHLEHAINIVKGIHNYAHCTLLYDLCKVYTSKKEFEKAAIICQQLEEMSENFNFNYWHQHAKLEKLKINIFNKKISYRQAFFEAKQSLAYCQEKNYFMHVLEYYKIIIQVLDFYNLNKQAVSYLSKYKKLIAQISSGLPAKLTAKIKKIYKYSTKDFSELLEFKFHTNSKIDIVTEQNELIKLLDIRDIERIKFFIWKMIKRFFAPSGFLVLIENEPFYVKNIEKSEIENYKKLISTQFATKVNKNSIVAPLEIDKVSKGLIVLENDTEIPYKAKEINLFKKLLPYLSYVIFQIINVSQVQTEKKLLQKMMGLNMLDCVEPKQIMTNILAFLLEVTEAKRGFWIEKDYVNNADGVNLWKLGLSDQGEYLHTQNFVSNHLIDSFGKRENFYKISSHLVSDKSFVQTLQRFSIPEFEIFLFPIVLDNRINSFLYIDTFQPQDEPNKLRLNKEFLHSFTSYVDKMLQTFKINQILKIQMEKQEKVTQIKSTAINIIKDSFLSPIEETKSLLTQATPDLEKALYNLSYLEHSINSSFYFSNPDALKATGHLNYSLEKLTNSVLNNYKYLTEKLEVKFSIRIDKLKVNKKSFLIALDNIILNAIQHAQNYIEIGSRKSKFNNERINDQESLIIYVNNDGEIPNLEELQSFFQKPFSQNSRRSVHEANNQELGIGLNLCKTIIEKMNGKIWILTRENVTTCYIALPIDKEN